MFQKIDIKISYIVIAVLCIAFARMIPHAPNYSPIASIALFSGALFVKKWKALFLTLGAMFLSDILINNTIYSNQFSTFTFFYEGMAWQYGAYILIALLGSISFSKISVLRVIGMSLLTSLVFFFVSNTGAWVTLPQIYSRDFLGFQSALVAGLPFLEATFYSDILYSIFLFGGYYFVQSKVDIFKFSDMKKA